MSNSDSADLVHTGGKQGGKPKRGNKLKPQEESEGESSSGELRTESPSQGGKPKRGKKLKPQEESSSGELRTESPSQDSPREIIPYGESEVVCGDREPATVYENLPCHPPHHPRWWLPGIRKDDEFFHFIILCFAIGTLLVCYYRYKDWTVSLGIGLMTFAALETTGIYFGLVHRIRSILQSFIPLLQSIRTPGLKKIN